LVLGIKLFYPIKANQWALLTLLGGILGVFGWVLGSFFSFSGNSFSSGYSLSSANLWSLYVVWQTGIAIAIGYCLKVNEAASPVTLSGAATAPSIIPAAGLIKPTESSPSAKAKHTRETLLWAIFILVLAVLAEFGYFLNVKEPIGGMYYKNGYAVYERSQTDSGFFSFPQVSYNRITGAYPGNFKYLGDNLYATDGKHIFCGSMMPNIDAASFQVLQNGYAKDNNNIYYNCNPLLKRADPSAEAMSFDMATVQPLNCYIVKDDTGVYINTHNDDPAMAGFKQVWNGFNLYFDEVLDQVPGADTNTFKITATGQSGCQAQDANTIYTFNYDNTGYHITPICDTSPPQGMSVSDWRDSCLTAYAVKNNNPSACDMLSVNSSYKSLCDSHFTAHPQ
jgi:hypothetical protein